MNALDVLCAQFTRDLFAIAKFLLTIGRLLLHCWYSLGRHVTTGTPMDIFVLFWLSVDCFWLFLTIGTPLVHCWYSLGRPVTINTPMVLSVFDDWYSVPFVKNSQKTVKTAKSPLVYQSSHVYQDCTNCVPIVKNCQKQSKDSQTAKKWPLLYQSSHVYTESAEYTKPRKRRYLA